MQNKISFGNCFSRANTCMASTIHTKNIKMTNQDKIKLEDDQNKFKWKTTKKIKMEDNQKRFK